MSSEKYDLIVFGATSFVGNILCQYLSSEYGINDKVRWAAAGRSEGKLEELRNSLGAEAEQLTLLVADVLLPL